MIEHSWKLTISAPCSTARRVRSRIREGYRPCRRRDARTAPRRPGCHAPAWVSDSLMMTDQKSSNGLRGLFHATALGAQENVAIEYSKRQGVQGPREKESDAGKQETRTGRRQDRQMHGRRGQPLRPGRVIAADHRAGRRQMGVNDEWEHEQEEATDDQPRYDEQAAADREGNAEEDRSQHHVEPVIGDLEKVAYMRPPAADLAYGHADHAAHEETGDHHPEQAAQKGHPGPNSPPIIPALTAAVKSHATPWPREVATIAASIVSDHVPQYRR